MSKNSKEIPVFFATDDNYAPFLAVSLTSLLDNASRDYAYRVYVLTTNLDPAYSSTLQKLVREHPADATIEFISLKNELDKIQGLFHLRDYYSKETYYRFFIPNLFPDYDKVLYMDCDIIVRDDISKLYNTELGDNLVAAAPEEVMAEVDVYGNYVEKALGCNRYTYFNAGIMLMNVLEFRRQRIAEQFVDLLQRFKFRVTQDEDYLNVLCKGKTVLVDLGWNKTAFRNDKFDDANLKIIHYKIHWKPWHYEGVEYEDEFWKYAARTPYYQQLLEMRGTYTDEQKEVDRVAYERLMAMAREDAADPNNYWNTVTRSHGVLSMFTGMVLSFAKMVRFKNLVNIKGWKAAYGDRESER